MLPLPAEGFASGSLDEDAFAPRSFIDKGLEVMVSQSYSKNLGRASSPMLIRLLSLAKKLSCLTA